MGHTALVLGDQLSHGNPVLDGADRVVLIESRAALTRLSFHRQRRHLVLSAMRHFADELRERDVEVVERRDVSTFADGLDGLDDVVCALPNSALGRRSLERLGVRFVASCQFLSDPHDFQAWADGRKRLLMEDFYREQRKRLGVLLGDDGGPLGGRWNFDQENRKPPKEGLTPPAPWLPSEDAIDEQVRHDLDAMALDEYGVDGPRVWPATAAEAKRTLDDFVANRLADFGPWQDAMVPGERWMYHARLASALNLWLLDPLDVVQAAEQAYRDDAAPISSVEGFVRQIIGWREYVWCMYWHRLTDWRADDALDAQAPVPDAFWSGETDLACLRDCVESVRETAYAHHIQRLMVLGNLLLLCSVEPWQAMEWFQLAFIDGAEWVMAPNAIGMATFGDGGVMMTKPYAAGGNYVNTMSRYCSGCRYKPNVRTGDDACPVTVLYWDFIARHRERLAGNHRMQMPLRNLDRIAPDELRSIRAHAREWRKRGLAPKASDAG